MPCLHEVNKGPSGTHQLPSGWALHLAWHQCHVQPSTPLLRCTHNRTPWGPLQFNRIGNHQQAPPNARVPGSRNANHNTVCPQGRGQCLGYMKLMRAHLGLFNFMPARALHLASTSCWPTSRSTCNNSAPPPGCAHHSMPQEQIQHSQDAVATTTPPPPAPCAQGSRNANHHTWMRPQGHGQAYTKVARQGLTFSVYAWRCSSHGINVMLAQHLPVRQFVAPLPSPARSADIPQPPPTHNNWCICQLAQ